MSNCPWISFHHTEQSTCIVEHRQAYRSINLTSTKHAHQYPVLIALIGRTKAALLRRSLNISNEDVLSEPHGQVRLWSLPRTRREKCPIVLLDCEAHNERISQSRPFTYGGCEVRRQLCAPDAGGHILQGTQNELGIRLYAQALAPLLSMVCFFSADLGGFMGVAETIALYVISGVELAMPQAVLPSALVIMPTASTCFDPEITRRKLMDTIVDVLMAVHGYEAVDSAIDRINLCFYSVQVLGLASSAGLSDRRSQKHLYSRLSLDAADAATRRRQYNYLFSFEHFQAFMSVSLDQFASGSTSALNLVKASRRGLGSHEEFVGHVTDFMTKLPTIGSIFELGVPFVASALVLDACPPGTHLFPPTTVFVELYEEFVVDAADRCLELTQTGEEAAFIAAIVDLFVFLFNGILEARLSAAEVHMETLRAHHGRLANIKSNKTCLCCLMRMPEKVFPCGHALCDICVRIFGKTCSRRRYTFLMDECILCGNQAELSVFTFVPPTAGIRILSLDGGGVRGVIPLVFLLSLEQELVSLACPLQDFFDLVCGTSSGGLIALGIFLKRWSPGKCLQQFEDLSSTIFKRRASGSQFFAKFRDLLASYLADCRYDSQAIEAALKSAFGSSLRLFNPLQSDTKVAVTSTTARESLLCLFSNYNGGPCRKERGYELVRAQEAEHDISVSEAARCTSAAPWYFKPKFLEHLGTFQDGGLCHTNPLVPALWEARRIWPCKGDPDVALSLGTGKVRNNLTGFRSSSRSPIRDRFLPRLFRSLMHSMDGERAWHELSNTLSEKSRTRLHRFNVPLVHEMELDDVAAIEALKSQATDFCRASAVPRTIRDSLFASSFYLELEEKPSMIGGSYPCTGHIHCRLNLSDQGRRGLYHHLKETAAYFLVDGRTTPCVEVSPRYNPPFRRRIKFTLQNLHDSIGISMRVSDMQPHLISGLPKTLAELIEAQGLDAPFGRIDHTRNEKSLPLTPQKRSVSRKEGSGFPLPQEQSPKRLRSSRSQIETRT